MNASTCWKRKWRENIPLPAHISRLSSFSQYEGATIDAKDIRRWWETMFWIVIFELQLLVW